MLWRRCPLGRAAVLSRVNPCPHFLGQHAPIFWANTVAALPAARASVRPNIAGAWVRRPRNLLPLPLSDPGYQWLLKEEAYVYLRALRRTQRRHLETVLDHLAAHPFTEPAYIDFDADGEELFHHFTGSHTVIYHVDHAVRRVLIQAICVNP